jgi:predicted dehydrogenase
MDPLRFGLLGTGYWALHAHGAALAASADAHLVGVWGRDPTRAGDVAQRLGTASYHDLEELLASVDAVAIAVPPDAQVGLAVRATKAGCHLLLEKPLALDVAGAEAVANAVDEAGVASVVFFTQRFNPDNERWAEQAAEAGPWHSAHLVHYANIFEPGNPFGASPWRQARGALWDIGPHALSAVLPVLGEVTSVAARRGPAGSDTVHLVLTHGESTVSTVSLSLTMPSAAAGNRLVLYGESGIWERPQSTFELSHALAMAISDLTSLAASGETQHRCDARFGLEVVRVLAAAEQALALPTLPGIDLS